MIRRARPLADLGIVRSRLALVDVAREGAASIGRRPVRTALTALGTVLGAAAAVTTLGLAATAERQVSDRFDAIRATEVIVQDAQPEQPTPPFPPDTDQRLEGLNGVNHAGIVIAVGDRTIARNPIADPTQGELLPVTAATPGALAAMRPQLASGRLYDSFHETRGEPVALLGRAAAVRLGITRIDNQPALFVDGHAFTIIGIVDDVVRRPETLLGIVIPTSTIEPLNRDGGATAVVEALIDTAPGAALTIAYQAPYALRPDDPARLQALAPPDPRTLRRHIEGDIHDLLLVLAAISFAIGAITIGNATLANLIQRIPEIGLRRALGARPRHIATHLLTETTTTGILAGTLGASLGTITTVIIATTQDWAPVLDLRASLLAPLAGATAGLLAGLYPAWQATHIQPAHALQR